MHSASRTFILGPRRLVTAPEALKTNTSLETINLETNSIGSDGAKALAEVRGRCPCECSLERVNGSPYVCLYCKVV